MKSLTAILLVLLSLVIAPRPAETAAATCSSSVGPGMPAPATFSVGLAGFHAQWYGQSGYPSLCPGDRATATVAYYNSGSLGWVAGRMGEAAYLGTWGPEPGQDRPSTLGGDGTAGSPSTGWPRFDRIAQQPASYVGPGQVAWFQFGVQAPAAPGHYRLHLRPLVEGATWLEDFGVYWLVTVLNPDGSRPPAPAAPSIEYRRQDVSTARGTFTASVIKAPLGSVAVKTLTANGIDCADQCPAKPLEQYVRESGALAGMNGTYFCPPDYAACAGKVNSFDYAIYDTALGRWINRPALIGQNSLVTFAGAAATSYRRSYVFAQSTSLSQAPIGAGVTMFPMLLQGGSIIDSESEQTAQQRVRGPRGSIGTDGGFVYLTIVAAATVTESAYVLHALGLRDALNLDGGGSSAMYAEGAYKVGPGRALPNAIVLTRPSA